MLMAIRCGMRSARRCPRYGAIWYRSAQTWLTIIRWPRSVARSLGLMDREERSDVLTEIAEILAAGLMRVRARQSSAFFPHNGDSSLDCAGPQSVDGEVLNSPGDAK